VPVNNRVLYGYDSNRNSPDAETQGAAKKPELAEAGIEEDVVEINESLDDDDTLIEEQEEEDADVTDMIGGDIENKEEG
jgi:hypothetical protein